MWSYLLNKKLGGKSDKKKISQQYEHGVTNNDGLLGYPHLQHGAHDINLIPPRAVRRMLLRLDIIQCVSEMPSDHLWCLHSL